MAIIFTFRYSRDRARSFRRLGNGVRSPQFKSGPNCPIENGSIHCAHLNQKDHIHQVFHPTVRRIRPRNGVSVELFRKLLRFGNRHELAWRDAGKAEPVASLD